MPPHRLLPSTFNTFVSLLMLLCLPLAPPHFPLTSIQRHFTLLHGLLATVTIQHFLVSFKHPHLLLKPPHFSLAPSQHVQHSLHFNSVSSPLHWLSTPHPHCLLASSFLVALLCLQATFQCTCCTFTVSLPPFSAVGLYCILVSF